jgi:hypothetical protein
MRIAITVTLALVAAAAAHATVPITTCGTTLPIRETGVLSADLTCPSGVPAVTLLASATLDLAGHTLTVQGSSGYAVDCQAGGCTIVGGGGAIVSEAGGVIASKRLIVSDLTIDGSGDAVNCLGRIDATNARVIGRGSVAIIGLTVVLDDVDVSGSRSGIIGIRKVRGVNVTANGTGNHGVAGDRLKLENCVAQANDGAGVVGTRVAIVGGTVTGNAAARNGVDIASARRPRLVGTTCGRSQVLDAPTTSWGVCSSD